MKLTKSDETIARVHIILSIISLAISVIFFIAIIMGIVVYQSTVSAGDALAQSMSSPWAVAAVVSFHRMTGSMGAEMVWWDLASFTGSLGVAMNFGVLVTSIMGLRVRNFEGVSWVGYLMGIISAGVSLSVIFNIMLWWLPGLVLTGFSLGFTVVTLRQIKQWRADHEDLA